MSTMGSRRAQPAPAICSCYVPRGTLKRGMTVLTLQPAKGRGAQSNASGRYESLAREAFDDGWPAEDEAPAPLRTTLTAEKARVILTTNDSPDISFNQSINPYRGCEHEVRNSSRCSCRWKIESHAPERRVGPRNSEVFTFLSRELADSFTLSE